MKKIILLAISLLATSTSFAGFEPITVVRPNTITTATDVMIGFDPLHFHQMLSVDLTLVMLK